MRPAAQCDRTDSPNSNSNAAKLPPCCRGGNGRQKRDLTKTKKRAVDPMFKSKSKVKFKNTSRNCSLMRSCAKKSNCAPKRQRVTVEKAAKGSGKDTLCSKRKASSSKRCSSLSYTAKVALAAARAIENYFRGPPKRRRCSKRMPADKARCAFQREKDMALDNTIGYLVSTSVTRANSPEIARWEGLISTNAIYFLH